VNFVSDTIENTSAHYSLGGRNVKCSHCGAERIVKNGTRKTTRMHNQKYLCTNCGKQFCQKHGKFSPELILSAICIYNGGKSLAKTAELVRKNYRVEVIPMTISRWTKRYGSNYLRIRDELLEKYPDVEVIASKQFVHSGLVYSYMLHQHKLREFCTHDGLKGYLSGLDVWVDKYFSSGIRCSQIQCSASVEIEQKKNFLCCAVGYALSACSDLRERHMLVQKYLLYNDSATIACEVPVWAFDKKLGPICGHIDLIQIRSGKVFVLDYKPGAAFLNKGKVVSQLFWYARALSFRAKIPMSKIRCCWFDEQSCFEFDPDRVKLNLSGVDQ